MNESLKAGVCPTVSLFVEPSIARVAIESLIESQKQQRNTRNPTKKKEAWGRYVIVVGPLSASVDKSALTLPDVSEWALADC